MIQENKDRNSVCRTQDISPRDRKSPSMIQENKDRNPAVKDCVERRLVAQHDPGEQGSKLDRAYQL